MPKLEGQKLKLLYLLDLLLENTDEDHSLTTQQIEEHMTKLGMRIRAKDVVNNIDELQSYFKEGEIEIAKEKVGKTNCYYVINRQFELAELKLLVDAVQSSKFISEKKSRDLIKKMEKFVSTYQAKELQRQVVVSGRVKTMNENIYINVDTIHKAILNNKQITFQYCQWNVKKELEPKYNGKYYELSPWVMLWDNGYYYMLGYAEEENKIKTYRVDKIKHIDLVNKKREGKDAYEKKVAGGISELAIKTFNMYSGEKKRDVRFRGKHYMIGTIIDRFGENIVVLPSKECPDCFEAYVKDVVISLHFLHWVLALGKDISIIEPEDVLEDMREEIKRVAEQYDV